MGDPPATILDLGSGDGYGAYALATALPGSRLLGIDHDPKAVEEALGNPGEAPTVFRPKVCPDCGQGLSREAQCWVCRNCGYSKCG